MSRTKIIHLTGQPPVEIVEAEWPEIGHAWRHDGPDKKQSTSRAWVRVRRHADGRHIVYGLRDDVREKSERKVGFLVEERDLLATVDRVCRLVEIESQPVFDSMAPKAV